MNTRHRHCAHCGVILPARTAREDSCYCRPCRTAYSKARRKRLRKGRPPVPPKHKPDFDPLMIALPLPIEVALTLVKHERYNHPIKSRL